jgi:hypothetical protein
MGDPVPHSGDLPPLNGGHPTPTVLGKTLDCFPDDQEAMDHGVICLVVREECATLHTVFKARYLFGSRFDVSQVRLPVTRHG